MISSSGRTPPPPPDMRMRTGGSSRRPSTFSRKACARHVCSETCAASRTGLGRSVDRVDARRLPAGAPAPRGEPRDRPVARRPVGDLSLAFETCARVAGSALTTARRGAWPPRASRSNGRDWRPARTTLRLRGAGGYRGRRRPKRARRPSMRVRTRASRGDWKPNGGARPARPRADRPRPAPRVG